MRAAGRGRAPYLSRVEQVADELGVQLRRGVVRDLVVGPHGAVHLRQAVLALPHVLHLPAARVRPLGERLPQHRYDRMPGGPDLTVAVGKSGEEGRREVKQVLRADGRRTRQCSGQTMREKNPRRSSVIV